MCSKEAHQNIPQIEEYRKRLETYLLLVLAFLPYTEFFHEPPPRFQGESVIIDDATALSRVERSVAAILALTSEFIVRA
jgi:hypothetical protein